MSSFADSLGRGAAVRRLALVGAGLVLAVSTAGCAVGGDVEQASPQPRAALAERAEVAAKNQVAADRRREAQRRRHDGLGSGGKKAGVADVAPAASRKGASTTARADTRPAAGARPGWTQLLSLADPVADHGDGPGYADLTGIAFRERGGMLEVSVDVASIVPGRLADREVQGVGIDFYRSSSDESDYQVFLDGGSRGWRAFLQTPHGFIDFPGRFSVTGRTLDVVVPWTALGGREAAKVEAFVDWSSGIGRLSSDGTIRTDLRPR